MNRRSTRGTRSGLRSCSPRSRVRCRRAAMPCVISFLWNAGQKPMRKNAGGRSHLPGKAAARISGSSPPASSRRRRRSARGRACSARRRRSCRDRLPRSRPRARRAGRAPIRARSRRRRTRRAAAAWRRRPRRPSAPSRGCGEHPGQVEHRRRRQLDLAVRGVDVVGLEVDRRTCRRRSRRARSWRDQRRDHRCCAARGAARERSLRSAPTMYAVANASPAPVGSPARARAGTSSACPPQYTVEPARAVGDDDLAHAERRRVAQHLRLFVGELQHPDVAQQFTVEVAVELERPDLAVRGRAPGRRTRRGAAGERGDRLERELVRARAARCAPSADGSSGTSAGPPDVAERVDRHRADVAVVGEREGRPSTCRARSARACRAGRAGGRSVLWSAAAQRATMRAGTRRRCSARAPWYGAAADLRRLARQDVTREVSEQRDHALRSMGLLATTRASAASPKAAAKLGSDAPPQGSACGCACATSSGPPGRPLRIEPLVDDEAGEPRTDHLDAQARHAKTSSRE